MFSVETLYPLSIALHLTSAALVFFFERKQRDVSANIWIAGTLIFTLGMIFILPVWQLPPFVRYFVVNFCALYSTFLYVYSLQYLVVGRYKIQWGGLVFSAIAAGTIFLLVHFSLKYLIGPTAGLIFAAVSFWAYRQIKVCLQILNNAFLKVMGGLFLASAFIWFIRIPLSQIYAFDLAVDPNQINFVLVFSAMLLVFLRQVTYFMLRMSLSHDQSLRQENTRSVYIEEQMLNSLNALSLARDNETGNHILRTQNYVRALALKLQAKGVYKNELSDSAIELMYKAAPLHDIGKVGIPDNILLKPGALDAAEWEIMKNHTFIGETVLSATAANGEIQTALMLKAIEIAGGHHEKWNGTGYPRGLKGTEIPLSARIMSVADTYDALVTRRVYKRQWTHQEAVDEIRLNAGVNFDPAVVSAFLEIQGEFQSIAEVNRDEE